MGLGAIVGGVASVAGSLIGGSKNSKAISKASDAQAAATKEATALQRDIYNKNVAIQQPFLNTGQAAMGQINALLGLNTAPAASGTPQTNPALAPVPAGDDPRRVNPRGFLTQIIRGMHEGGQYVDQETLDRLGISSPVNTLPAQGTAAQPTQVSANDAYNQFKNYTGYQTRLNEGLNSINGGYAASGTLQSGAALKALNRFGQDYASNEFGNYMGYLGQQQQLGPGAANALAGVGTNYANAAGNLAMQNGNNIANAAIAKANNSNSMWQGIAGGIGSIFGNSSFGG
jgi:hypothetical protein